jgi:hypothetical protein
MPPSLPQRPRADEFGRALYKVAIVAIFISAVVYYYYCIFAVGA